MSYLPIPTHPATPTSPYLPIHHHPNQPHPYSIHPTQNHRPTSITYPPFHPPTHPPHNHPPPILPSSPAFCFYVIKDISPFSPWFGIWFFKLGNNETKGWINRDWILWHSTLMAFAVTSLVVVSLSGCADRCVCMSGPVDCLAVWYIFIWLCGVSGQTWNAMRTL